MKDCDDARVLGVTMPCCPNCHAETLPDTVMVKGEPWTVCCQVATELLKGAQ
jgi:hypothetical protein